jgi:glycosyltransferase involved in cell wall biosynthesis
MNLPKVNAKIKTLAIVIPVFNEEKVIVELLAQLKETISLFPKEISVRLVFVNNGSSDSTVTKITENWHDAVRTQVVTLSRNFGYEAGIIAGLEFADSDLYAVVDGDGEDPISLLPRFLDEILSGADIVQGLRLKRREPQTLQLFRKLSYLVLSKISDEPFQMNSGNFSMFRAVVRDGILLENSFFPFMRATLSRIGYVVVQIPHDRNVRIGGVSHYRRIALIKFAILGFLTTTTWPLRFSMYWALIVSFFTFSAFIVSFFIEISSNFWLKLIVIGVSQVFVFIGIASIYIARIYKFVIGRPQYYFDLSRSYSNFD